MIEPTEPAAPVAVDNARSPLGTNLSEVRDWEPGWPFVDALKESRDWIAGTQDTWDNGSQLDLDSHGWVRSLKPGQVARTVMFTGMTHGYPAGRYIVLYEGKGTIEYGDAARKLDAESRPGRDVVLVEDPSRGGIEVRITATDPSDYLRNIHFLMPGGVCSNDGTELRHSQSECTGGAIFVPFEKNYDSQIFYPPFLKALKAYNTIRFMDWMDTNSSSYAHWDNRPTAGDVRYSTEGVPIEIIVALANRMHANPWINIHHLATDSDVEHVATYVRDHLDPSLKVYVEHSNEVWNAQFPQYHYADSQARAQGLTGGDSEFEGVLRYHSKRTVEIAKIFERVFGGTDRLVRVMASQAFNSWVSQQLLDYRDALDHTDALAIAPYMAATIDQGDQGLLSGMSTSAMIEYFKNVWIPEANKATQQTAAVTKPRGVALIAYEAGQHLAWWWDNPSLERKLNDVNRDPGMKEVYTRYLEGWKAAGGELMAHYYLVGPYTKYGSWGSMEYLDQPLSQAPKADALLTFMQNNARWW